MAHPCPEWEYETHPKKKKLAPRVETVLRRLRFKQLDGVRASQDSRQVHGELFQDLTPPHFPHFAGHYRGERLPCLENQIVFTRGDPRVGAPPAQVGPRIEALKTVVANGIGAADQIVTSTTLSERDKMIHIIGFACAVFDMFLQIHPYTNGNGHVARFIMWAIIGRYGYWPVRWTVEPRPPNPPYLPLLLQHRDGNRMPFVEYVLQCIK